MVYLRYLLLLVLGTSVGFAQNLEPQRDTLRQRTPSNRGFDYNNQSDISVTAPTTQSPVVTGRRFGAFGSVDFNNHSVDFKTLPGIPNCCSRFTDGAAVGSTFGFLAEYPISDQIVFGLRAGYTNNRATLQKNEYSTVLAGDSAAVPAVFEHTINGSPATIGLAPIIGYRVTEQLQLHAGTELGYLIGKKFDQGERIIEPQVGQFADGRRIRNDVAGNLPNSNPVQASMLVGTSYEFPINQSHSLLAVPEFFYSFGLTNIVKGLHWRANSARLGMAIKYAPDNKYRAPMPVPVIAESERKILDSLGALQPMDAIARQAMAEAVPSLSAAVSAMEVRADGSELPISKLGVEEYISTNLRPLLNYVFFDENSATIPERYVKLPAEQASRFREENLYNVKTIPTYHQILNVIGSRMKRNPDATITLVGNNADMGTEKGNRNLSMQRASTVRDYLRDIWGINSNRIRLESRNLPTQPSNVNDPDGIAENRRVEIQSNHWGIVEPILTADTLRRTTTQVVRFRPNAMAQAGIADWRLTASENGTTIKMFNGTSQLPEKIDWMVDAEHATTPNSNGPLDYVLEVTDVAGQKTTTPVGSIPVERTTIKSRLPSPYDYKQVDRFSLILFDFDQAGLNEQNRRIVDHVRNRVSPNAAVTVTGYTDRIGDADYNARLSENRARLTAIALNAPNSTVTGLGESSPQYDNTLPEGRFYNRTVDVVVETPVK